MKVYIKKNQGPLKKGMVLEKDNGSLYGAEVLLGGTEECPNGTFVSLAGLPYKAYDFLAIPNTYNGVIHLWSSTGEWENYWVLDHPWPKKKEGNFYVRLRQGESLKDNFPDNKSRAVQMDWIRQRKSCWFPEKELKPVRKV
jgi:hypothetical protein